MKQTAVEWLATYLKSITSLNCDEVIQQAKEIEKEQIIEAYCQGCLDITKDENIFPRETSEQYYNETYKGNNHIADTNKMVCEHLYSRSMNQPYPRKCTKCGEVEKEDKQ